MKPPSVAAIMRLGKSLTSSSLLQFFVLILLLVSTINNADAQNPIITTFAGTGERGYYEGDDNNALTAKYESINGIAVDAEGNVYVNDFQNYCIRKIDVNGKTSIVAGIPKQAGAYPPLTGNPNAGPATTTAIPASSNLAMATDKTIYFSLGPFQTGGVNTAGNLFYAPQISPSHITIETYGDYLYRGTGGGVTVVNRFTNEVVGTITGTGSVRGIAIDASGNLYFSNTEGFIAYAAAGQFTATTYVPYHIDLLVNDGDLAIDPDGNLYFVNGNGYVIKIDPATKSQKIINISGAQFLRGLAVGPNGDVYVVDAGGCKVYKMGMPSKNANLSALTMDAGALIPEFNQDQLSYTASVPFNTPSIKLTPTLADATARVYVRLNNGSFSQVVSGTTSAALPLNIGENIIDIRVNAQDATVQKNYQLTVTREEPIPGEATISTAQPGAITAYSAVLGGDITDDGGETITERGVEYDVVSGFEPGIGMQVAAAVAGTGAYTVEVTGLNAGTTYYARAYAINAATETYGTEVSFKTNTPPAVTDVELTGVAEVGRRLNSTYTYSDAEHSTENGSTYAWYRYDAVTGDAGKALIEGANAAQYTLQVADEDKFIAVEVTPHDGTDAGAPGVSNRLGPIELGILPDTENRLYVKKGNTTGNGTGSSWSDALPELAEALQWARERWLESTTETGWTAENPLEIWVSEGVYKPAFSAADDQIGQNGNRDNAFVLVPYVQLYGGFVGGEEDKAERDWNAHETVLNGDLDNTNNWSDADAYHVVIAVGQTNYPIDQHTVVDGFALTGGYGNAAHSSMIAVNGRNLDRNFGGGIANLYASPTLSNLRITSNLAFNGGGVYNISSSPKLTNVAIRGNSGGNGGGMINRSSSPTIINSMITGNTGTDGGGLHNISSAPVLVNVTIAGNQANTGGGVSNNSGSATLRNSIVWGNNSGLAGSGFTLTHSLVQGSGDTGNGNLGGEVDPEFVDAKVPGLNTAGDYRVSATSVIVNKGDNVAYVNAGGNLAIDLDHAGNARLSGCAIDLGAYEIPGQICITPSADHVLYVNQAVNTDRETYTGKGDSWENALTELADALKWAREQWGVNGSGAGWDEDNPLQIWVAKGTYKPGYKVAELDDDGDATTNRDKAFMLVPYVQLYGGFSGTEIAGGDFQELLIGRDLQANGTLLSGDLAGDDDPNNPVANKSDNAHHVVIGVGNEDYPIDGLTLLDGFTITGGQSETAGVTDGVTINSQSVARFHGAGMVNVNASPKLTSVTISGNVAGNSGGGIANFTSSDIVLINVVIRDNTAGNGGGMYNANANPLLVNVAITGNKAKTGSVGGGGIFNFNSSVGLTNVTISGNETAKNGGGIYNRGSSVVEIDNSIVWGNIADGEGNQFYNEGASSVTIGHSLYGNDGGDLGGTAMDSGESNLHDDPQFADAESGDYTLLPNSPAINAGDNDAYTGANGNLESDADLASMPRLRWDTIDLGAFEYQLPPVPVLAVLEDGTYKIGDDLVFAVNFYAPITVSGEPTLPLTVGETGKIAVFAGLSEDKKIATFNYRVVEGDLDDDGLEMLGTIELTAGGSIAFEDHEQGDVSLAYSPESTLTQVTIDGVRPVLTNISISSDNANPTAAKIGDKVVVTIKASEAIAEPEVEIGGNTVAVSAVDENGLEWKVEYVLTDADKAGSVGFVIGGISDKADNNAPDVTTVTDESTVTFYKSAPMIEGVEDGEYYNADVTAAFDEGTALLNGEPYESGTPITEEGGYKLTVRDAAGNSTTVAFTVDKTAPEVTGVTDGDHYHYNEDITVTFNEGTAVLNGEPYEMGTPVTAEGEYELVVTDAAGNLTTVVFTIDKTAPEITGVTDGEYYNDDVTAAFNEGAATLNGKPYVSGTPVMAEGEYELVVTDLAGNTTTVTFVIDKTSPEVTGVTDGDHYNEDITVTFNEGKAMLNGEPYIAGTPITVEGEYELVVMDAAGNETVIPFTIDKTPPVVEGILDGLPYGDEVTATFNEGTATLNGKPYVSGTPVTAEGEYELVVTDLAGNTTTVTFIIDKTAPEVIGVIDSEHYNEDITVTFNEGKAILNGEPYVAGTPITVEGEYELVVTDLAGNEMTVAFTIDKTAPQITGVTDGEYYNDDVTATFNEGMTILNGKPYVSGTPITAEGEYELVVTDLAGNATAVTFVIDKTSPEIAGITDGGYYNKDVTATINEGKAMLNGEPYVAGTPITAEGEYELVVTDAAGNKTVIRITIDKTPPVVMGVESGKSYSPGVMVTVNEGKATLNGKPYLPGTPIIGGGSYALVVTDATGNVTTVDFTVGSVSSAPTGVEATAGNKQISLAWDTPAGGVIPITDYTIEYSGDGGQTWTLVEHAPSATTRAVVIGLENNRPYQFRIAAVNAAGIGGFSTVVTAIPTEPVPDTEGSLPEPKPGETVVITDGKVEAVVLEVVDEEYLRLRGDGYALMLSSLGVDGERIPISAIDAVIRLVRGEGAAVYISGNGFEPGTVVTVYLFSIPELVGHLTVDGSGNFAGTLPVPTNLELGQHTLQANGIVAGGGERSVSVGLLLVDNKSQAIDFNGLVDRTYGDGPVVLEAKASSGLPISFSVSNTDGTATDIATLKNGNELHIHKAGDIRIVASQAGDLDYAPAAPLVQTLHIAKAPLTIGTSDVVRAYGEPNPTFRPLYSGFVNGEDAAALNTQPQAATAATETSAPGSYAITVSGGESSNYVFTYDPATLTVVKAQQVITFTAPAEVDRSAGSIQLDVSSSSGLPVTLSLDDPQVATVNGSTLDIHRLGTVHITATQAGDGNYEAAEPVTVTLRVVDPSSDFAVRVHPAVSPNGDGINEFLMVEGIKDFPENRVTVISRNGTVLWEASGYDNDRVVFRGISTAQQQLPAGTYFYIVEVQVNGKWEHRKGYFVIRY